MSTLLVWHRGAGVPKAGVAGRLMTIEVVALLAQKETAGVKVNVMLPFKAAGLKLLFVTPCPDQVPVMPPCVVGKAMGWSVWQIVAGTPLILGAGPVPTLILVVALEAQKDGAGVKVNVILPLRPAGLKLLLVTPWPDQLPVMPSCVVGNEMGLADWQILAGTPVMAGAPPVPTSIVVVAGSAQKEASGVKVSVMMPFKPEGLKILLITPCPDQSPVMPSCIFGKVIGGADSQIEDGTPLRVGGPPLPTVISVVAPTAQMPASGAKVNV